MLQCTKKNKETAGSGGVGVGVVGAKSKNEGRATTATGPETTVVSPGLRPPPVRQH